MLLYVLKRQHPSCFELSHHFSLDESFEEAGDSREIVRFGANGHYTIIGSQGDSEFVSIGERWIGT